MTGAGAEPGGMRTSLPRRHRVWRAECLAMLVAIPVLSLMIVLPALARR